jgi:hypothetical protein
MTDQGRDEEGTTPGAPGADGESEVEGDASGTTQPIEPTGPTQAVPVEQPPPSQWPYAPPPSEAPAPDAGSPFGPPSPPPEASPPYGAPYGTPPPPPEAPPPSATPYGTPAPPPEAPPYGAPTYGQAGYPAPQYGSGYGAPGYPAPGYPMGPVRSPEASSLRSQAITALILNILAVVFCCGLASIGGAIMAGLAIGRVDTDLPVARRQLAWSWGLLAANLVIALILAGILVATIGATNRP